MNKADIIDRAHNKAFSKIIDLKRDISQLNEDIRKGGDGRLSLDILKNCVLSTRTELQVWQFISTLIEKYGYK
jgi:hypothetical protein